MQKFNVVYYVFCLHSCNHLYHSSCLGLSGALLGATCLLCDKSTKPSSFSGQIITASWVRGYYVACSIWSEWIVVVVGSVYL